MAEMTHEYSNFPTTLYSVHRFLDLKDAPSNVAALVETIKTYTLNGQYAQAAMVLEDNKNVLAQYLLDARYINALDEELRNLEIYTKAKKQALYYTADKPDAVVGDVWIS